ncbi:MAG: helix-turn-helix transcriptional regulator, partial [Alphaproteobacteria bacterium]|nr:helix-turn-helix transcriptional regulator [Alphaproteobacteria bacterium]
GEELVPIELVDRLLAGESPVKVWREHRGMRQNKLAEAAGLKQPYLSQIEAGKREGSLDTMARIARALEVDLDDLVPGARE